MSILPASGRDVGKPRGLSPLTTSSKPVPDATARRRWRYLALSVLRMVTIANVQYGWSVFVLPLHDTRGRAVSAIQYSVAIFVALETWGAPVSGWITDRIGPRFGPRVVMGAGGVLVAAGWIINAYATGLVALIVATVIAVILVVAVLRPAANQRHEYAG